MEIPSKRTVTVSQSNTMFYALYLEFRDEQGNVQHTRTIDNHDAHDLIEIGIAIGKWVMRGELDFSR